MTPPSPPQVCTTRAESGPWRERRCAGSGPSPQRWHLRMGRRGIASMPGVAHGAVGRPFTGQTSRRSVTCQPAGMRAMGV